ncbi:signal peptidase I [Candidatus Falkowbacteria bacterium CG11_big_fil_rev_8_21_14_0_20_39_10]|uniref:Signal peptidase I n=1 Tax=Candidatus Falkowbacteria bacterium CG11_big_fil_rev_8_21_14_0_20_39_10 TaxID=1974570 RepID=A0A2M6K869_9BACT|nr:MAG: signal peptidase I [Candidatus Falkowbacteria bacterium CG11_big_fil_rev_8_21_14_0_20_39_10]
MDKRIFIIVIIAILFISISIYNYKAFIKKPTFDNIVSQNNCDIKIEERIVRGNSLSGLIESGQTVEILFGFYDCNEIKREDRVVYNYAGDSEPIIKIVKGIPDDKFQLKKSGADCWNILINGGILGNSQNMPYCFSEHGYRMLSLYEKDYNGIIPQDVYLILGNLAEGSLDSARFGLIGKNDILGKAIR